MALTIGDQAASSSGRDAESRHANGTLPPAAEQNASQESNHSGPDGPSSCRDGTFRYPGLPQQTQRVCLRDSPYKEEQVVRLIMQELHDRGFTDTLSQLQRESGFTLEDEPVACFRASILAGEWSEVESALPLIGIDTESNKKAAMFAIKRQQFLELLEERKLKQALLILQNELSALTQDIPQLHRLSSLLMCPSPAELRTAAAWDGSKGRSRFQVLEALQSFISPGKMVPIHRMETLFDQAIDRQSDACECHVVSAGHDLYTDHVCSMPIFPKDLQIKLEGHTDEVWYVAFSPNGRYLASGSNDKTCILWDMESYTMITKLEGHESAVSYLAWSPDSKYIVSSSSDKTLRLWDVASGTCKHTFTEHSEVATSCKWLGDSDKFISASTDHKIIIWNTQGTIVKQISSPRVYDIAVSTDCSLLLVADNHSTIHVYDLSTLTFMYKLEEPTGILSMALSSDAKYCLTQLKNSSLHMWDLSTRTRVRDFSGHDQGDYVIRCVFAGLEDRFIATGSKDGTLFIWNKDSGRLLERLKSHTKTINGCAWNGSIAALATASDDKTICIWPAYKGAPSDISDKPDSASAALDGSISDAKSMESDESG